MQHGNALGVQMAVNGGLVLHHGVPFQPMHHAHDLCAAEDVPPVLQ